MAASRLSDSQKIELVARFRAGEGSQGLASAYGCSAATVTRAVRAALDPEEYERLKQQGGRRASATAGAAAPVDSAATAAASLAAAVDDDDGEILADDLDDGPADDGPGETEEGDDEGAPGVLAIDDADDFGDEDEDEDDDLLGDEGEDGCLAAGTAPGITIRQGGVVEALPLTEAALPASAYMLVDKTVELQARPLSDFPELGPLAPEEQQRQALVVFLNPRQAKRQCGRSQRVIKIPDPSVFERTSRFLVAQGISRVLIEGSLYSLPGS